MLWTPIWQQIVKNQCRLSIVSRLEATLITKVKYFQSQSRFHADFCSKRYWQLSKWVRASLIIEWVMGNIYVMVRLERKYKLFPWTMGLSVLPYWWCTVICFDNWNRTHCLLIYVYNSNELIYTFILWRGKFLYITTRLNSESKKRNTCVM